MLKFRFLVGRSVSEKKELASFPELQYNLNEGVEE